MKAFDIEITESNGMLAGPWRQPKQMLNAQVYDSHASIHDDATAQRLGFQGGTIEGPTHFSQFAPLCERIWGNAWFETGCLSAHYRNPVFEGEEVQASIEQPRPGQSICAIGMTRRDGTEILRGTASVGGDGSETALSERLKELKPLTDPVILKDITPVMKTARQTIRMDADQDIRLLRGPLFVGESYTTEREVVALSGSRRTESMWVRTTVFAGDGKPAATMLLNLASIKQSYARYEEEYEGLYGKKSA